MRDGGEIKYEDICVSYQQQYHGRVTKRQIMRALTGSRATLFAGVSKIPRFPSTGLPLFETTGNGRTIKFNNKKQ